MGVEPIAAATKRLVTAYLGEAGRPLILPRRPLIFPMSFEGIQGMVTEQGYTPYARPEPYRTDCKPWCAGAEIESGKWNGRIIFACVYCGRQVTGAPDDWRRND